MLCPVNGVGPNVDDLAIARRAWMPHFDGVEIEHAGPLVASRWLPPECNSFAGTLGLRPARSNDCTRVFHCVIEGCGARFEVTTKGASGFRRARWRRLLKPPSSSAKAMDSLVAQGRASRLRSVLYLRSPRPARGATCPMFSEMF